MGNQYKPQIKSLITIHTALLAGQIITLFLFYFLAGRLNHGGDQQLFKSLQVVAAIVAIASISASFIIFKKRVTQLQLSDSNLSERLNLYLAACILKFALIEVPVLFSIIAYFISPNASFIVLAVLLIVLFALQRPTIPMLMKDIGADKEDFFE